ncbi:unnamed protein product, partial [Staurois parvus]
MAPSVKHGGGQCSSVGCMSVGEWHFINSIMIPQMYCSILKEKFPNMSMIQNIHLRPLLQ